MVLEDVVLMLSAAAVRSLSVPSNPVMLFSKINEEFVWKSPNVARFPENLKVAWQSNGSEAIVKAERSKLNFDIVSPIVFIPFNYGENHC